MKRALVASLAFAAALAGAATGIVQDQCGPFTDVSPTICPYVLEMYYLGITAGTSPTTYSPDNPVTRGQAAVFVSRGVNQAIARSSRRAALGQWWQPKDTINIPLTTIGSLPYACASDGADIWTTVVGDSLVARVRASDGRLLESWTGATNALAVIVAMGRVFLTRNYPPASLFMIDPAQPAGDVVPVTDDIGLGAYGLAFDGSRIWIANGPISIVTPGPTAPWAVQQVTVPGASYGFVFDGQNMWITGSTSLLKLDANGAILQTVPLSGGPGFPVFDGENIWVPVGSPDGLDVVRASTGTLIATLTGNGLVTPYAAAFDGQRVLVSTSYSNTVSVWNAASLTPLGFVSTGPFSLPFQPCSDGINFWIPLNGSAALARF